MQQPLEQIRIDTDNGPVLINITPMSLERVTEPKPDQKTEEKKPITAREPKPEKNKFFCLVCYKKNTIGYCCDESSISSGIYHDNVRISLGSF